MAVSLTFGISASWITRPFLVSPCKKNMNANQAFCSHQGKLDKMVFLLLPCTKCQARWWFQPNWKICSSKLESSLNRDENRKYLKPPPSKAHTQGSGGSNPALGLRLENRPVKHQTQILWVSPFVTKVLSGHVVAAMLSWVITHVYYVQIQKVEAACDVIMTTFNH